ncbi:hypothetical protein F4803DRAFT_555630 [Xylaria telfairii]|nr:hypothetical protein F4803DRAFT_555630 [Xylaria telfairii]
MNDIQTKDQLPLSVMASPQFHFYPRLPNELKCKIWEQVFEEWSSGAHRFQLLNDPKSDTKLVMRPSNDQKDDVSAWRERLALSKIDACSCYVFHSRQRDASKRKRLRILYKDTAYSRRIRVEENGVVAMIDTETDLVTFKFSYGTTQASLALLYSTIENKDIFAGITQVGIEMELLTKGHSKQDKKHRPFGFPCYCRFFRILGDCHCGAVDFLRWFDDLKVVYIIFTLKTNTGHEIIESFNRRAELSDLHEGKPKTKQPIPEAFRILQDTAEKEGLKQFYDRKGVYCEISRLDSQLLSFSPSMLVDSLHDTWRQSHLIRRFQKKDWRTVKFKSLIWTDKLGATVTGQGQPLRRAKPW